MLYSPNGLLRSKMRNNMLNTALFVRWTAKIYAFIRR